MKIQVRASSGEHFTIPFPTGLLANPVAIGRLLKYAEKYAKVRVPQISKEQINTLCNHIKRIRKLHGHWELVHVESAGGDLVSIIL